MLNLLIIDGNTPETNHLLRRSGGRPQSELFEEILRSTGSAYSRTLFAADPATPLPHSEELNTYHGLLWTGSALNVYDPIPPVTRQIELAQRALLAGAFIYGSCWGLQVSVAACSGKVQPNPHGRHIGVARQITLTAAGKNHPLLQGRPQQFDALAVHRDAVSPLPEPTMTVLATSSACAIQAAELRLGPGRFFGVQYHPEYSFADIASAYRRYAPRLVEEGMFPNLDAVNHTAALYQACDAPDQPQAQAARSQLNISAALSNPHSRRLEILNWLRELASRT